MFMHRNLFAHMWRKKIVYVCVCVNTLWTFIKVRYSVKTKRKLEDFHFISFLIFAPTLYYIKINCRRSFSFFISPFGFCFADSIFPFNDSFHFVIELLDVHIRGLNVCLLLFSFVRCRCRCSCYFFFAFSRLLSIYSL